MAIKEEKQKKEITGWFLIGIMILMIVGAIFVGRYFKSEDKLKLEFKNNQIISFFISVYDKTNQVKGSFVFYYYPGNNRTAIVSILPKTYISFGTKVGNFTLEESLNKHFSHEDIKGAVEKLVGTKIDYYVFLDETNLSRLIDMTGGVEIYTEGIKINELNVNIPSGLITLDGDKAIEYLSYINNKDKLDDYYDQIKRSQNMIRSFIRLKEDFNDSINQDVIKIYLSKLVSTNLRLSDMVIIYNELKKRFANNIRDYSKGCESIVIYCDKKNADGYDFVFQPKTSGEWARQQIKESLNNIKSSISVAVSNNITIEILNGTDAVGFAKRVKQYLETFGFDVIELGNADTNNYEKTLILYRTGEAKGNKLGDLIKCKKIMKGDEYINKKIDVTLILGKDFDGKVVK